MSIPATWNTVAALCGFIDARDCGLSFAMDWKICVRMFLRKKLVYQSHIFRIYGTWEFMRISWRVLWAVLWLVPMWSNGDEIDAFVLEEMGKAKVPGVSIAIVREGKVTKARGYGLA